MKRRLLKMIAALAAGEKLPVSAFARELGATASVVIDQVQALIADGALDKATLRPVAAETADAAADAGTLLFDALVAEGRRRGLSIQQTSLAVFANPARIYALRGREPRAVTLAKAEAWLGQPIAAPKQDPAPCGDGGPSGPGEADAKAPPSPPSAVTGEQLYLELEAAAAKAGVSLSQLLRAYFAPYDPRWKLEQLRIAKRPQAATIRRVRHFIATGEILPSANAVGEKRRLGDAASKSERIEDSKLEAEVAHATRKPGESLADAVAREASQRQDTIQRSLRAGGGVSDDKRFVSRRSGFINTSPALPEREFETPSSVLRQAQRDWPDQCEKVKAIAAEIEVTLAEAWRRVIAAGVMCLEEGE